MLIVKVLDIFVVFLTLFQNLNGKVRKALIIKWIGNHTSILETLKLFSLYFFDNSRFLHISHKVTNKTVTGKFV